MLTLKRTDSEGNNYYIRLPNTTKMDWAAVQDKIKTGWRYCPKEEWKVNVRDRVVEQ